MASHIRRPKPPPLVSARSPPEYIWEIMEAGAPSTWSGWAALPESIRRWSRDRETPSRGQVDGRSAVRSLRSPTVDGRRRAARGRRSANEACRLRGSRRTSRAREDTYDSWASRSGRFPTGR